MSKYTYQPLSPNKSEPGQTQKRGRRGAGCLSLIGYLFQLGLVGLLATVVILIGSYIYLNRELSNQISQVVNFRGSGVGGTPRFFDRHGELLFELTTVEKRQWLQYGQIPATVINATVAVEDDTFWSNPGFDPTALGAAIISNLRNEGRPIGASTITQQLVKHVAFSYQQRIDTDVRRKILEILYSFILTQQRSKPDILEMYLNEIYYGNLAYGIEAAAQTYFNKPAAELDLAEAAFLAAIPQSPRDWDPYTNLAGVKERQAFILDLMVEDGLVDAGAAAEAKDRYLAPAPLIPLAQQVSDETLAAAHFVLYIRDIIEQRYGATRLTRNGWQVTTSLDLNIQRLAEQAARGHVAARSAQYDVTNAAVVAVKPTTGEILAMVGSLDYFDETISGQVNMAVQPRQPGSSFKPITYVTAMEKGWNTGDVLWDVPIKLDLGGSRLMQPSNYDGRYHGPVLFRDALANSYNIPPIQLLRDVGIPAVLATGRRLGVQSLREESSYYGLALTLGGGEVPLLEMTHAYATLANAGRRPLLNGVIKIVDSAGNVIYDIQRERLPATNAVDPRIAYIVTDILSDNQARTPAMGGYSSLRLPFPAAAKTGTTNDYRDNWTIGYTPGLVVGVWSGNADGHPMRNTSGLFGAAPIWNQIMQGVYADASMKESLTVGGMEPPTEFIRPDGIVEQDVCLPRGTGGATCTASRRDLFLHGVPAHGIGRIGYRPDVLSQPGAWKLALLPLPAADAHAFWQGQPELQDGTRAPLPTHCVFNSARAPDGVAVRLMLPVPPFYPDEVRARIWANQTGYAIAPSAACPVSVARGVSGGTSGRGSAASSNGGQLLTTDSAGGGAGSATGDGGTIVRISSPQPGQTIGGVFPVMGTVVYGAGQGYYFKLELNRPGEGWVTVGSTHQQPVDGGLLEQLYTEALPAGNYTIRLVAVGPDGNYAATHSVAVTIP